MATSQEALDRLVFSAGEQDYRWADVVAAARAWGRWDELADQTSAGLGAIERLAQPIGQAELDEAMQAFRYARGLIAAEEMEAWLEHWGLRAQDWSGLPPPRDRSRASARRGRLPA